MQSAARGRQARRKARAAKEEDEDHVLDSHEQQDSAEVAHNAALRDAIAESAADHGLAGGRLREMQAQRCFWDASSYSVIERIEGTALTRCALEVAMFIYMARFGANATNDAGPVRQPGGVFCARKCHLRVVVLSCARVYCAVLTIPGPLPAARRP